MTPAYFPEFSLSHQICKHSCFLLLITDAYSFFLLSRESSVDTWEQVLIILTSGTKRPLSAAIKETRCTPRTQLISSHNCGVLFKLLRNEYISVLHKTQSQTQNWHLWSSELFSLIANAETFGTKLTYATRWLHMRSFTARYTALHFENSILDNTSNLHHIFIWEIDSRWMEESPLSRVHTRWHMSCHLVGRHEQWHKKYLNVFHCKEPSGSVVQVPTLMSAALFTSLRPNWILP